MQNIHKTGLSWDFIKNSGFVSVILIMVTFYELLKINKIDEKSLSKKSKSFRIIFYQNSPYIGRIRYNKIFFCENFLV